MKLFFQIMPWLHINIFQFILNSYRHTVGSGLFHIIEICLPNPSIFFSSCIPLKLFQTLSFVGFSCLNFFSICCFDCNVFDFTPQLMLLKSHQHCWWLNDLWFRIRICWQRFAYNFWSLLTYIFCYASIWSSMKNMTCAVFPFKTVYFLATTYITVTFLAKIHCFLYVLLQIKPVRIWATQRSIAVCIKNCLKIFAIVIFLNFLPSLGFANRTNAIWCLTL